MRFLKTIFLAFLLVQLSGCILGRTTHREQMNDEGGSYSTSLSLHGDSDKAMLDRGKELVMENRFDDAAATFLGLYEKASAPAEIREAALFELGEVYSNVLNPGRDSARALGFFRRLVEEFPESKLADRAREQIAFMEGTK